MGSEGECEAEVRSSIQHLYQLLKAAGRLHPESFHATMPLVLAICVHVTRVQIKTYEERLKKTRKMWQKLIRPLANKYRIRSAEDGDGDHTTPRLRTKFVDSVFVCWTICMERLTRRDMQDIGTYKEKLKTFSVHAGI